MPVYDPREFGGQVSRPVKDTPILKGEEGEHFFALAEARVTIERLTRENEELRKDAERWRIGKRIYFPEYCPHDDGAPNGSGWFHQSLDGQWFDTPDEAIDAALAKQEVKDE